MNFSGVLAIISHTFRESIRAKWLIIFAVVFFLLAINIPVLFLLSARYLPADYLRVFLSSLVGLTFPFIPLLALPMGAAAIVDERESGTIQYLLSNPISKSEFFLGRLAGLLLATSAVIFLGFGFASIFVYSLDIGRLLALGGAILIAGALNAVMLGIAFLISMFSKRKATAMGTGIFVWFLFTVVSDIGFLSVVINLSYGWLVAVPIILLNPVESSRILAVLQLGSGMDQMGATGLIVNYFLGSSAYGIILTSILIWIAVFFIAGLLVFRHQDLV